MHVVAETRRETGWAGLQICAVLFTIVAGLWTQGRTQIFWFAAAFITLLICVVSSRPKYEELGIGYRGLTGASLWALPTAFLASTAMLFIAWQSGTLRPLHGNLPVHFHAIFYAIWAFEQQFILNSFFYRRFEILFGESKAMVITAALFALVHLPNPVLVPATFVGALFFITVFRRWRNIYPLAIAHAVLGLTLAVVFPDSLMRHMRVGLGYLTFPS